MSSTKPCQESVNQSITRFIDQSISQSISSEAEKINSKEGVCPTSKVYVYVQRLCPKCMSNVYVYVQFLCQMSMSMTISSNDPGKWGTSTRRCQADGSSPFVRLFSQHPFSAGQTQYRAECAYDSSAARFNYTRMPSGTNSPSIFLQYEISLRPRKLYPPFLDVRISEGGNVLPVQSTNNEKER